MYGNNFYTGVVSLENVSDFYLKVIALRLCDFSSISEAINEKMYLEILINLLQLRK